MSTANGHGSGGPKASMRSSSKGAMASAFGLTSRPIAEREAGAHSSPTTRGFEAATQQTIWMKAWCVPGRVLFSVEWVWSTLKSRQEELGLTAQHSGSHGSRRVHTPRPRKNPGSSLSLVCGRTDNRIRSPRREASSR